MTYCVRFLVRMIRLDIGSLGDAFSLALFRFCMSFTEVVSLFIC